MFSKKILAAWSKYRYSQTMVVTAVGGTYLALLYPETWGLKNMKQLLQHYTDGIPTVVDPDSMQLCQKVLNLIHQVTKVNIEFYTVFGQDTTSHGSTHTQSGVIIGIPHNFSYKSEENVEKQEITINNKTVDWTTVAGKQLSHSFVFSEKAKKFAIAREIMSADTFQVYSQPVIGPMSLLLGYLPTFYLHLTLGLPSMRPLFRLLVYGTMSILTATFYFLCHDSYRNSCEIKADIKAANLGEEFAEGGVEYYNQILNGNKALRVLMGAKGEKCYTIYGNEYHSMRTPHYPVVARRDNLVKYLEKTYRSSTLQI